MLVCKHCGTEARTSFLFCPTCGIRDAFSDQREESWSERLKKRFFNSAIEKRIGKIFQDMMTIGGNPAAEMALERLYLASRSSTDKERVGNSLALAYGIRAQDEEQYGDSETAISLFERAREVASKESRWHERMGRSTYKLARALDIYQKHYVTSLMGPDIVKLEEMVDAKKSPSDLYGRALEAYSDALQCDPYHVPAFIGRARTFAKLDKKAESNEDYQKAVDILTRALIVDANDLSSRSERAEAFEALGQTQKAIQDLKHSVAVKEDEWLERRIKELEKRSD